MNEKSNDLVYIVKSGMIEIENKMYKEGCYIYLKEKEYVIEGEGSVLSLDGLLLRNKGIGLDNLYKSI